MSEVYEQGWRDAVDAITRHISAQRNNFLMPKNRHEQLRLHSLNRVINTLDQFADSQAAIAEYEEDKAAGFPRHTHIRGA